MVQKKSSQLKSKGKFDTKIAKFKIDWIKNYQSNIQSILDNAEILENGRRTIRPLKHYRKFLDWTGISERTSQRIASIGKRNKEKNLLTLSIESLPNSYPTIEILLRLSDAKFLTLVKTKKINRSMSRKDAHILVSGKDSLKDKKLKDKLLDTVPFSNIRIDNEFKNEKLVMALLKELKKLKSKYNFIDFDDRGYVDRLKAKLKREAKQLQEDIEFKKSGKGKKQKELEDLMSRLSGGGRRDKLKKFRL